MRHKSPNIAAIVSLCLFVLLAYAATAGLAGSPTLGNPAAAQQSGQVPGDALGNASDAEIWRQVRKGLQGTVSIPNKEAGILIQSEGENWRAIRNGPLSTWGVWLQIGRSSCRARVGKYV